ncbi:MAG: VOC family protein [Candidatus Pacebacteria bacterium]|nr:VOC family protein [Candidatus Paceibacterota bacterium]
MLEHVSVPVRNFEKAKAFYLAALKPLGYKLTQDYSPQAAGFKQGGHTSFWIAAKKQQDTTHIAFRAKSRAEVRAFHKAALKAGGKDNGKPGVRKDYSPDYYAAFVFDPDGNNIEAVTFKKN